LTWLVITKNAWKRRFNCVNISWRERVFWPTKGTGVSFSSCEWNLIKTFQIEAMIALITKMALVFS
jgi:hypothetical protein